MPKLSEPRLHVRRRTALIVGLLLASLGAGALPAAASANSSQIAIFQDFNDLYNAPASFAELRALGASTVRVFLPWATIAPNPTSSRKPHFNATDPGAYTAARWAPYDTIMRTAAADHMAIDLTVTGGAPVWAEGSGIPRQGRNNPFYAWKPSAAAYGQFFTAVGKRYNGQYTPHGESSALPRVHFWAIYNEPNFGQDLGPEAVNGSRTPYAPMAYRNIVDAGWKALHATGHGHDTILIGEFAARGNIFLSPRRNLPEGLPGNYGQIKPLIFTRLLYCVDNNYKPLRGSAARAIGCPTKGSTASFRRAHPGLFNASAVSDHPYPDNLSPVSDGKSDPNYAALPDLSRFGHAYDLVNHAYGSRTHYAIYNTEYGYITHPPQRSHYPSPTTAAYYLNWAEYLSYKNPRVKSYMQYLLADPAPSTGRYQGFASGLESASGVHKPAYDAYRLPLYMPGTSFSKGASAEVWGAVRPASLARLDGFGTQQAQIQLNTGSGGFKTVQTVRITNSSGYFDVHMRFPAGGTVRLQWTYPNDPLLPSDFAGQTITSRSFKISVH